MNELLNQLAKALKVPTDTLQQVVNHYPELRQQFVTLKVLSYTENALHLIGIIALIVFAYNWYSQDEIGVDKKKNKKIRISSATVGIAALVIATIIHVVVIMVTPDIQVIMEVIKR